MSEVVAKGLSPRKVAWLRFKRNKLAMGALIYLGINVLVALAGYPLLPDDTQQANFQVAELPKQGPGTQVVMLLQPNYPVPAQRGWVGYLLHGRVDASRAIPIQRSPNVNAAELRAAYVDLRGNAQSLDLPSFLLPIDKFAEVTMGYKANYGRPYQLEGRSVYYMGKDSVAHVADVDSLIAAFRSEHVVERTFWLGTDGAGRDVLSRLMLGGRVTLGVGFMAMLLSLFLGILFGALAGFFRGWVDTVVMWFVSVVWSIPTLLLAIAIAFALGKGTWQLFLAIGASSWVEVARIVRGQIFSLREMQYVEAAKALGYRSFRTIVRHVLPNAMGPLIIIATANFASAVLLEAGLSFLGVGVQAPAPSWGGMIREGYAQVMFDSGMWLAIFPGLAMVLVVISLNLVGYGLRDAFDPNYDR